MKKISFSISMLVVTVLVSPIPVRAQGEYQASTAECIPGCDGACNSGAVLGCDQICDSGATYGCDGVCGSTAEIDECGVCEGNGPVGNCACGQRPDECGVCDGDGSTCTCANIQVDTRSLGGSRRGEPVVRGSASNLECVQAILESCNSNNRTVWNQRDSNANADDCVVYELYFGIGSYALRRAGGRAVDRSYATDSQYYLDYSCNRVEVNAAEVCENLNAVWIGTPISLVLDERVSLNQIQSVTTFPVNPNVDALWFPWRGSAKTPLLVWDPGQTGSITNSGQLFGNWTFGGKSESVTNISLQHHKASQPWRDGYEALATLDHDLSGAIDGFELENLSLWFDANQNGVSEKGEVQALSKVGIVRLFYSNAYRDMKTNDLVVINGFEILLDGVLHSGRSIDWYTQGFASKIEAIQALQTRAVVMNDTTINDAELDDVTKELLVLDNQLLALQVNDESEALLGAWKWHAEDTDDKEAGGMLLFEKDGEEIRGTSYIEVPFQNSDKLKSMVVRQKLRLLQGPGNTFVAMIKDKRGGMTQSHFYFTLDGKGLRGESTWDLSGSYSSAIEYKWSANRLR